MTRDIVGCERRLEIAGPQGSPEWVEQRRQYIGASDIGPVLGLSPYSGPVSVWLQKRGKWAPPMNFLMMLGSMMEPTILSLWYHQHYGALFGPNIWRPSWACQHPTIDELAVNLDAVGLIGDVPIVIEAKHMGARYSGMIRRFAEGGPPEGPLISYWLQVQAQLACTGLTNGHLAILSDKSFGLIPVVRDSEAVDIIESEIPAFWHRFILPGVMPTPNPSDVKTIDDSHAPNAGISLYAPELAETIESARELAREIAAKKKEREALEVLVKARMNEAHAEFCDVGDGSKPVTWKETSTGRKPFRLNY